MPGRKSFLRSFTLSLACAALVACAAAQSCPPEPQLKDGPFAEYQLEGFIGGKAARMFLSRGGNAVIGVFYFTANWNPVMLGGSWSGNTSILMRDETGDCAVDESFGEGLLRGTVNAEGFEGTWRPDHQSKSAKVRMRKLVGDRCSARGPMREFSDPHWPVTFSYPADWHLQVAADTITLTCPDPSLMAYEDMQITITRGKGSNPEGFSLCGGKWWSGSDCSCEETKNCVAAAVTTLNEMTLISTFDPRRLYCKSAGYVGMGEGSDGAVLLDDGWIEFEGSWPPAAAVEPIMRTIRKRP